MICEYVYVWMHGIYIVQVHRDLHRQDTEASLLASTWILLQAGWQLYKECGCVLGHFCASTSCFFFLSGLQYN